MTAAKLIPIIPRSTLDAGSIIVDNSTARTATSVAIANAKSIHRQFATLISADRQ